MCLILFAVDPAPDLALVLAANRDEDHSRPTLAAHAWPAPSRIFGGRDERGGGTWLAAVPGGRLAAVTNVRHPGARREGRSRGALPVRFASSPESIIDVARSIAPELGAFPAFNLIAASPEEGTFSWSEEDGPIVRMPPGVHGLSNARIDVPWPKVVRGKAALSAALDGPRDALAERLFMALANEEVARDDELPSTGVSLEIERLLGPAFIRGPAYGTRSSTVVIVERSGRTIFEERSFGRDGAPTGTVRAEI
ncbi:MAG: NRDE family protein [Polyangiaceae bacterium]|nr:NRDE family protein [Polyangiaceae bacterium]